MQRQLSFPLAVALALGVLILLSSFVLLLPGSSSAAWLNLNPYAGNASTTVGVQGFGFGQNEQVGVSLDGQSTQAQTDNSGNFNSSLTVPQQPAGSYQVTAQGKTSGASANAPYYINGYYPKVSPSSWYLSPGQTLSFAGSGFAPYETVTVSGTQNFTVVADQNGSFSNAGSVTVPYSWQNNKQSFTFSGNRSAYSITIQTSVGSFYPNLDPSSYYVGYGQGMSASVSGLAPNEQVELRVNGSAVGQQQANGSGNASFSFNAPNSGSTFTLAATGLSSGKSSTRTVTLH
jgi:hypothetical protein